ncbi:AMP phosphorylase [Candidatus Woesearchaeota archaeon]|nr:AMP phosphorylase [Candidatus Woesearchaeota archaeon]
MNLKIKKVNICTGDSFIALLNKADAIFYDLYQGDRVKISNKKGEEVVVVLNITSHEETLPKGYIGIFEDILTRVKFKNNEVVKIKPQQKPKSISYIRKKLKGKRLSYDEFLEIIRDIIDNQLSHIETTYFVAATYMHELTIKETINLTKAMYHSGDTLNFGHKLVLDKHCVGGVAGNRTTMLVVPIIAAAGYIIPKTSSRSITSAAGTSDTVEVLCKVDLGINQLRKVVESTNACLSWGGALNLAPADDKIIKVEHPVSLDPKGQLLASILAKKKSVGTNILLVDIPVGRDAKIKTKKEAISLKRRFLKVGRALRLKIKVVITDGSSPVGRGIGPALEARDVLWTLRGDPRGDHNLRVKSLFLASKLLAMAGEKRPQQLAKKLLDSGAAYEKFIEIIRAQGGYEVDPSKIRLGNHTFDYTAKKSGVVSHINNKYVNRIARIAGAPVDKEAGVYLNIRKGGIVKKGDVLFKVYSDNNEKIDYAKKYSNDVEGIIIDALD